MLACAMSGSDKRDGPGEVGTRAPGAGCSMLGMYAGGGRGVARRGHALDQAAPLVVVRASGWREGSGGLVKQEVMHLSYDVRWGMTCENQSLAMFTEKRRRPRHHTQQMQT